MKKALLTLIVGTSIGLAVPFHFGYAATTVSDLGIDDFYLLSGGNSTWSIFIDNIQDTITPGSPAYLQLRWVYYDGVDSFYYCNGSFDTIANVANPQDHALEQILDHSLYPYPNLSQVDLIINTDDNSLDADGCLSPPENTFQNFFYWRYDDYMASFTSTTTSTATTTTEVDFSSLNLGIASLVFLSAFGLFFRMTSS